MIELIEERIYEALRLAKRDQDKIIEKAKGDRKWIQDTQS